MKIYKIIKKPTGATWEKVPIAYLDIELETPHVDVFATAQVCYDNENLYVRMTARESDIRAELTGALDMPCRDSCLEFFFAPLLDNERYFNVEFNPNCCMFLGIGTGVDNLVRLLPQAHDPKASNIFEPRASRTSDGWEIVYRIPVSFIQMFFPNFTIVSGNFIRGNFYKCGEMTAQPHCYSWNMLSDPKGTFHCPWDFGVLEFE